LPGPGAEANSLAPGAFFGRVARQRKRGLLTLSLVSHPVARRVPPHGHDHAFVTFLLRGAYEERVEGIRIVYEPLSVVFHPLGIVHEDEILAPSEFFTVELAPAFLSGRLGKLPSLRSVRDLSGGSAVWGMLRLFSDFVGRESDALSFEEPVAELVSSLAGLRGAQSGSKEPPWLSGVDRFLRERYREPLSLDFLSKVFSVHPVYLSRVFREHRDRSLRATLHGIRVLEASKLLLRGVPLAEIALATGFADQSHFTNVFHRVTGFTPAALRKRLPREISHAG
jgi:AraC-like DNA-binding protein